MAAFLHCANKVEATWARFESDAVRLVLVRETQILPALWQMNRFRPVDHVASGAQRHSDAFAVASAVLCHRAVRVSRRPHQILI
jgi:hypothetical protein